MNSVTTYIRYSWLSVDPLAEQTMDAYGYVYQNPIRLVDPMGMSPDDIIKVFKDGTIERTATDDNPSSPKCVRSKQ
ncbi:MAG: hypothetical protein H6604_08160 [Flavobacteriales bacterium]|nr:hypothetical protein [Flavobacteriales bacterium]